jgi:hypothetical protein
MKKPYEYADELVTTGGKDALEHLETNIKTHTTRFRLYTAIHSYSISMILPSPEKPNGYMGCIASCRAPYPGETHTRGNDLPDGPYSDETWHAILAAIVRYEILPLYRSSGFIPVRNTGTEANA